MDMDQLDYIIKINKASYFTTRFWNENGNGTSNK